MNFIEIFNCYFLDFISIFLTFIDSVFMCIRDTQSRLGWSLVYFHADGSRAGFRRKL